MIGLNSGRSPLLLLGLATVALLASATAQAAPPAKPSPDGATAQAGPQASGPLAPASAAPGVLPADVPPPPDPHAVAVETLAAPGSGNLGLVGTAGGGFADTLWHGTSGPAARAMVGALPHRYVVPGARQLAQRFLQSAAGVEAPPTPTADQAADLQSTDPISPPLDPVPAPPPAEDQATALLQARIAALAAMAAWDDVIALIDLLPLDARSQDLMRLRVTGQLAKGRMELACSDGAQALALSTDIFWQKLQITCQVMAGQYSAAAVSLALLHEAGSDDKVFLWAVDMFQGRDRAPPVDLMHADGSIDPIVLALLRSHGWLLPEAIVKTGDPTTLMVAAQIAQAPPPPPVAAPEPPPKPVKGKAGKKAPPPAPPKPKPEALEELRLFTIERAVAAGVADVGALRTAYSNLDLHDEADVQVDHIAVDTARQRAATYQLALAQSVPGARAEVVARVFDLTRFSTNDPGMMTTALIYAPVISGLPVSPDLFWFAGTAIRVLTVVDSLAAVPPAEGHGAAQPWIDALESTWPMTRDMTVALASAWPYLHLAAPASTAAARGDLEGWEETIPPDPPTRREELHAVALDLLTALDPDVAPRPEQPAAPVVTEDAPAVSPDPATLLWNAMSTAAREGRVGETVALSLNLLGSDAGSQTSAAMAHAVKSLNTVGRANDARAIALQCAFERGL